MRAYTVTRVDEDRFKNDDVAEVLEEILDSNDNSVAVVEF